MKNIDLKRLDEKDEEIADTLISLGISRPVARVLAYLRQVNEATSSELVMKTNLPQPEVSLAMKELKERGWITERDEKNPEGKMHKIYSLKVGFNDIIARIKGQLRKAVMGNVYSRVFSNPANNIICKKRYLCGAIICPSDVDLSNSSLSLSPPCFLEKFDRYQPKGTIDLFKNELKEANNITWKQVFSFEDSWLSILIFIFILLFVGYMLMSFYKYI